MDNTRAFEEVDGSHVFVAHCTAFNAWGDWYLFEKQTPKKKIASLYCVEALNKHLPDHAFIKKLQYF